MKTTFFAVPLLAALASAAPAPQLGAGGAGTTSNDIQNGQCGDITLVMARGSTEPGNMGTIVGSGLCAAMKQQANVACQGVGGAYKAEIAPNLQPKGTDQASIDQAVQVMMQAFSACPNAKMTVAGYSQGTAVMSNAIQALPAAMQSKIAGVAFWGYTKNAQTMSMIPNFPNNKLQVNCRPDDGVCGGQLDVTAGHLAYANDGSVPKGASFLVGQAQGAAA